MEVPWICVCVVENAFKTYVTKEGKEEEAIHQPEKTIQVNKKGTTPYKEVPNVQQDSQTTTTSLNDGVSALIQQNNYTNNCLQSFGRQSSRIW